MRVLYISYTGLMEPLGQSQVLQYLRALARDHEITLLTYERPADLRDRERFRALAAEVEAAGIHWSVLRYHRRFSLAATAYDVSLGLVAGARLVKRRRIQAVHARSYVAAVMGLALRRLLGLRFIFDMRGFWADERVDGGVWGARSVAYRAAKWFERRFLLNADVVVSLTRAGVRAMREYPYLRASPPSFQVIPTCTNLELFRLMPEERRRPGARPFTVGYAGSVRAWYLFEPVVESFLLLRERRPDARLVILNRGDHAWIREQLRARGAPAGAVEIRAVPFAEVPREMNRMDATLFFIRPVFSKLASAPTKLGEFLGCGVPCLTNAGVGDVEEILAGGQAGVVVPGLSRDELAAGVEALLRLAADPQTPARCVEVARRHFALEDGVRQYDEIYRALA